MDLKIKDVSGFIQQAALVAHDITTHLMGQQPQSAAELAQQMASGGVQLDVRICDVLGGMPRIDLVAVTATGEAVVGSRLCKRRQSEEA